jgi:hypothetical protein
VEDNKTVKAQLLQCKNIIHVYVLLEITHTPIFTFHHATG